MAAESTDMVIDASRAKTLSSNLSSISARIAKQANGRDVRLVAVSKLKPAADILALHQEPMSHQHFGENYAQELTEKAQMLPSSIKWHFIGGLQSNKCKPLASSIPNLWCVSSVDSIKKANQLDAGRASLSPVPRALNVHVQVNTSGEDSKSGCQPGKETMELCQHIQKECKHLNILGLMTIRAIARSHASTAETANEDFDALKKERDAVSKELHLDLELSMGMSDDFEAAIAQGSGEVRVGSTIFGERPLRADFNVKETNEEAKS